MTVPLRIKKLSRPARRNALAIAFFALAGLCMAGPIWLHAGRSKDRYGVLWAIFQIRTGQKKVALVRGNPQTVVAEWDRPKSGINSYMQRYGWTYKDQGGAILYYRKGREEMQVSILPMASYQVYTLAREPGPNP